MCVERKRDSVCMRREGKRERDKMQRDRERLCVDR